MSSKRTYGLIASLIAAPFLLTGCAGKLFNDLKSPQDSLQFVQTAQVKQYAIKPPYQKKLASDYLDNYFSPWKAESLPAETLQEVKTMEEDEITAYLKKPGWGENKRPYSQAWVNAIAANMQLGSFPNYQRRVITVHGTDARLLPTNDPSFTNWTSPGEGYPFDNLQVSYLPANKPLRSLQITADGAWTLVRTPNKFVAWVPTKSIAEVNSGFIKDWKRSAYLVPLRENIGVKNNRGQFCFLTRFGQIYPHYKTTANGYQFLAATSNANRQATIQVASLPKAYLAPWPLAMTTANVARLSNQLIGNPYGWGGLYGYRDCSSTLMDLYTAFAITLPRNSADQALQGEVVSLAGLSNSEKEARIRRIGIPFFTLISTWGHIMVYTGTLDSQANVFNDIWGLRVYSVTGDNGRSIIGRTVIMPLTLGSNYWNVRSNLLSRINRMTLLVPPSELEPIN